MAAVLRRHHGRSHVALLVRGAGPVKALRLAWQVTVWALGAVGWGSLLWLAWTVRHGVP